jgi:hypothetical protein
VLTANCHFRRLFHILCEEEFLVAMATENIVIFTVRDALMFGEIYLSAKGRVNNVLSDHVTEDSITRNYYAKKP